MTYKKYVVKVEEGYLFKTEAPHKTEVSIVPLIQNATVYEFSDKYTSENLNNDIFVQFLFREAMREGGTSPQLVKISIAEIK